MSKLIKIKGDASFRSFFRKKVNGKSSIVVYAKKEKFKNLLVYDAINKILNKNKILAPRLYTPLVAEANPAPPYDSSVPSPKSIVFPDDDISIY